MLPELACFVDDDRWDVSCGVTGCLGLSVVLGASGDQADVLGLLMRLVMRVVLGVGVDGLCCRR